MDPTPSTAPTVATLSPPAVESPADRMAQLEQELRREMERYQREVVQVREENIRLLEESRVLTSSVRRFTRFLADREHEIEDATELVIEHLTYITDRG